MRTIGQGLRGAVGMIMLAAFAWLAVRWLQGGGLRDAFLTLFHSPGLLMLMTSAYFASFLLKAAAWRMYAEAGQPLWKHLAPIGYSLFVNHLLPVKAGDLVRTGLAARLERQKWDETLHTVAVMRAMDISVLVVFGGVGTFWLGVAWKPGAAWTAVAAGLLCAAAAYAAVRIARKRGSGFACRQLELLRQLRTRKAFAAWGMTAASWVLEGFVPFGVLAAMSGAVRVTFPEAVWTNSMTVAGQLFQVTPGGIGTYETSMSASLAALGVSGATALQAAVVSHAYKFIFAYAAGLASWLILPASFEEAVRWLTRRRAGKEEAAE